MEGNPPVVPADEQNRRIGLRDEAKTYLTERGIESGQENALKGHTFTSLEAQNAHLLRWETNIADQRIHGTTRTQVGKAFREVEQPALQPLPRERFPTFHEAERM